MEVKEAFPSHSLEVKIERFVEVLIVTNGVIGKRSRLTPDERVILLSTKVYETVWSVRRVEPRAAP